VFLGTSRAKNPPQYFDLCFFEAKSEVAAEGETEDRRIAGGASRSGYREGETSGSQKPTDGFGMKQGRGGARGVRRQEVEKT